MNVPKTIKLYVGGKFPRTESGRSYPLFKKNGEEYARLCQSSRKDFRDAVTSAKQGEKTWSSRTTFNRSQILYRMAEMVEGKKEEFTALFKDVLGLSEEDSQVMTAQGRDAFVYYAGFCDKLAQIVGSVNTINGPHHHFSTPESMGIVMLIEGDSFDFERLCATISAILVGGNSLIVLLGKGCPAVLAPLAEVFATSDVPAGVVNLLTGDLSELYTHIASHREVRSIHYQHNDMNVFHEMKQLATNNMKRMVVGRKHCLGLQPILDHVEIKSVWHPIGV